jgi:MFS family permease
MSITLTTRETRPATGLILLTMSLGVLIAQIDTSVVNLAIKQIGTDFEAGVTALQWIVDAYNLVYASLLLSAGTLADLYGRRLIFALGIALFTLGTLVCGLAPDVPTLVGGRAVAGLGAALEVPASLAVLTIAYPDTKERTRALGIWASCYGIAMVIGPTIGGVLVDASGWRSIFLLIVPFCVVTLFLVMTSVPESSSPQGRRLDLPGQALAIAALGSFSLAAIEGPRWGWASTASVAAFSLSVAAAALFLRRQPCNRGARAAAHAAPPRVYRLPRRSRWDDLRRLCDAVPHPALFPDCARRFGAGCRARAAADVAELHGDIAALRTHR